MSADFTIRIDLHHHQAPDQTILDAVQSLKEIIMATHAELTAQLNAAAAQAEKSKAEVVAAVGALKTEVEALKAQIAAGGADVPPEVIEAANRVSAAVDAIDQLHPDA